MVDGLLYVDKNIKKSTKEEQLFHFPSHDLVAMEINLQIILGQTVAALTSKEM